MKTEKITEYVTFTVQFYWFN